MGARVGGGLFGRSSGTFVREARARGLKKRAARTLESSAHEVCPDDPAEILGSRELFEEAATRAVVGDGGNLELSFSLVDELASTVEELGLARASDVPDPFRRVWVKNGAGRKIRGVVLTRRDGEVAVFCPPAERAIAEIGGVLWLEYRGFSSTVEYDLQLDDSVRLPGALVLHLKRRSGGGAIGRESVRYPTNLGGVLRVLDGADASQTECIVTDLSVGGVAVESDVLFVQGTRVRLQCSLPDGSDAPFTAEGEVRWVREDVDGRHGCGVSFQDLPRPRVERLERVLARLEAGEFGEDPPTVALARVPRAPEPEPTEIEVTLEVDTAVEDGGEESSMAVDDLRGVGRTEPGRPAAASDQDLVTAVVRAVARAAVVVTERSIAYSNVHAERVGAPVAGAGGPQVAFVFELRTADDVREGCVLVPLEDAAAMASAYSGFPEEALRESRALGAPDRLLKVALLQLGELVSNAVARAYRRVGRRPIRVRTRGCHHLVEDEVAPIEGSDLVLGRCRARMGEFPSFQLVALLPPTDS